MKLYIEMTPTNIAIIVTLCALAIILIGILIYIPIFKGKAKKAIQNEIPTNSELADLLIKAAGGKDNITQVLYKMTRLTLNIKTSSLVNTELVGDIKAIIMETKVTFIVGSDAENIAKDIESLLK